MTFKELNDLIQSKLSPDKLFINKRNNSNDVEYKINSTISICISQTQKGKNTIYIKENLKDSTSKKVWLFYDCGESLIRDFLELCLSLEKESIKTISEIYEKNLNPKTISIKYEHIIDDYIISIINRPTFKMISLSLYKQGEDFPVDNLLINKEIDSDKIIPIISHITNRTRNIRDIAKELTGGTIMTKTNKLELFAKEIIATTKYEDTCQLETKWLQILKESSETEIRASESSMEIYSVALDSFDTYDNEERTKEGFNVKFLTTALMEITFIFCGKNMEDTCQALKDIALKPETEAMLNRVPVMARVMGRLEEILASAPSPPEISYETTEKILKEIKEIKEINKIFNIENDINIYNKY